MFDLRISPPRCSLSFSWAFSVLKHERWRTEGAMLPDREEVLEKCAAVVCGWGSFQIHPCCALKALADV